MPFYPETRTSNAACLRLRPAGTLVFDETHFRRTKRMPLPLSHPAVHGIMDAEFTIEILWISESVEHSRAEEFDAYGRCPSIVDPRVPPYCGDSINS
jgi:hypothetical protein